MTIGAFSVQLELETKEERHTRATHSHSGAEHPCPARSDRGTEKNMGNIGDLTRLRKGQWTPDTSCADPETPRFSESTPTLRSDWVWKGNPPWRCCDP